MALSDFIASFAVLMSGLSLLISLWIAYKSAKFSDCQLRLSNRAELHKILLEIDRELLHDPSLNSMFRSNPAGLRASSLPLDTRKQEIYFAMYLNLFELSFAQFKEIKNLSLAEKEVSEAWDRFIISFFEDCVQAKVLWSRFGDTFYSSFRSYIDLIVAQVDAKEKSDSLALNSVGKPFTDPDEAPPRRRA